MIHSCDEVGLNDETPNRKWYIHASLDIGPADISRLCGKIPKMHETYEHPKHGLVECIEIGYVPLPDGYWELTATYKPKTPEIAIANADDEPHFPPYDGPKGQQPDGSFILTPRCYHSMKEMIRNSWMRIPMSHHPELEKFRDTVEKECDIAFEVYT